MVIKVAWEHLAALVQKPKPNPEQGVHWPGKFSQEGLSKTRTSMHGCLKDWLLWEPTRIAMPEFIFPSLLVTCGRLMSFWYDMQAQFLSNDPSYLSCKKECKSYSGKECALRNCSGSVTFHVVNFRTDIKFVFFTGGFVTPCVLRRSDPIGFANPDSPLYGHLSSIDSTGTSVSRISFQSVHNCMTPACPCKP